MSSLVNYESGDESEDDNKMDESNSFESSNKKGSHKEEQMHQKMEDEWDNFEKMISDKSGDQQKQNALDPLNSDMISYPSYKQSTDFTRKSPSIVASTVLTTSATKTTTTTSTSHVKNNLEEKNLKRKFCEERSSKESEKKKEIYDPHNDDEEEDEDSSSSGADDKRSSSSSQSYQDKCKSMKERKEDKNTHMERKSDKMETEKFTCKTKESPPESRKRKISDIDKDDNSTKDNKSVKDKNENDVERRHFDSKNKMKKRSRSRSFSKKRRESYSRSRSKEDRHHHRSQRHRRSSKTREDSRSSSRSPRRKDRKRRDRRDDVDIKRRRHRRSKSRSHSRHRRRNRHHSRSSSSSNSLPRFTRAVIPVKPQTQSVVIPPKKPNKPTVMPTMKSGTTLPAMFAELQNSDFKEQLKAMFVDAQTKSPDEIAKEIQLDETKLLKAKEKKSALPLNNQNPLAAMVASGSKATAQQALSQTMAAMHAKVQEITGVAVPKYYNPSAVNPLKYAEQLKKRKMLWSKNKEADATTAATAAVAATTAAEKVEKETEVKLDIKSQLQWSGTSFSADDDGKMAAKFKKLMGIKQDGSSILPSNVDITKLSEEQRKKQEELFQQLDREYEFARMATHTCRGVGFGFASSHNLPGS